MVESLAICKDLSMEGTAMTDKGAAIFRGGRLRVGTGRWFTHQLLTPHLTILADTVAAG